MRNPIGWFEIYVNDIDRAKEFYTTVLGITLEAMSDPTDSNAEMCMFPSNFEEYGATGALIKMQGMTAGGNSTMVYFSCADCAVEESRVEQAGGKVEQSKTSLGEHGFCTLAVDTEGNKFGLHSQT